MKNHMGRSCLGGLLLLSLCGLVALFIAATLFQQSQAVLSNATATRSAHDSPLKRPTATRVPFESPVPPIVVTETDLLLQVEPTIVDTPAPVSSVELPPATGTSMPISTPLARPTETEGPRHSGTSTYPLTVTAEVMLALTHVAQYQAGVSATRTAIAIESAEIYATLTAGAPTQAGGVP